MRTRGSTPRYRSPPPIAWVLVLAVLVGTAAALLSRPVASYLPTTSELGSAPGPEVFMVLSLLIVAGLVYLIYVYVRGWKDRVGIPQRFTVTFLMILLLGAGFVAIAWWIAPPVLRGSGPISPPGNHTGAGGVPSQNNSTLGAPGGFPFSNFVPPWVPYAVALGIALATVLVVVPFLLTRRREHRERSSLGGPEEAARAAMSETLMQLGQGSFGDARALILALYARLLARVAEPLGGIDHLTAREIEAALSQSLGVRPGTAHALTEMFEEARYSTHPLGPESVARARSALEETLAEMKVAQPAVP